ncbi:hypothetical protein F4779DRAFT_620219 [Xylariaceae sp. FL0662B]|nr:hypothetical protein F4779DRAFT_620219 [Xylariaceae sp. FL0662B]
MSASKVPHARRALMVDPTLTKVEPIEYDTWTTDVKIRCGGELWFVHTDVITRYSNFFKRALYGGFREANAKEVVVRGVDKKIMGFVIEYVYSGWRSAITKLVVAKLATVRQMGAFSYVSTETIAKILIVADYLDMEVLRGDAYSELCLQIAAIVREVKYEIQWKHNLGRLRPGFVAASEILRSQGSSPYREIGERIVRFLNSLMLVDLLRDAFYLYSVTFPDGMSEINWVFQW